MPDMRCFANGCMEIQHDAILESFGMTEEIVVSLTRLLPTTNSVLFFPIFSSKIFETYLLVFFFIFIEITLFRLNRKILIIGILLG